MCPRERKHAGRLWPEYDRGVFCPDQEWPSRQSHYGITGGWRPRRRRNNCWRQADEKLSDTWLTMSRCAAYIPRIRCAAARRNGAPVKLFTDTGDRAIDWSRRQRVSSALWSVRRRDSCVPGCLTGESEKEKRGRRSPCEPCACELQFAQVDSDLSAMRLDETSAVHVSGQHHNFAKAVDVAAMQIASAPVRARKFRWDLVKRCDQPEQYLIQLESLILAQSERWRQA